ncbi:FIG00994629: hypothetical protein [Alloactinosynnema sp. L-07]|uniref:bifunctional MaoC family dehydratase N-terminal/OB-fold nucleic acid binding domain-containing protein n=1 Tax=Alloactinosynnema sp. L-07 TaxID=1653480 RepID=UPI00065EF744|nr:OB-fold domain-containing protein [Alloactinosynnema sp. L-07]CRK57784.1 FIG00994629: hypothetical protein [Alloactinosynnema sp. L-07]
MTTYEDRLAAFTGRVLVERRFGPDPVNVPMIRHWCEAMGDTNPVHLSDEAARSTGRSGIVAPASMMQAWTMRGYAASTTPADIGAFDELVALLDEGGYTSVVATDSDFDFHREARPGDDLSVEEVVESISAEKRTGLGTGRFVSTLKTYRDAAGEVVATQRWRTLRFRPSAAPRAPRPRPAINQDNEFWFAAAREKRLVVQRCTECKTLRHPPGPCCPECQSFAWDTVTAGGRGTLYSYVVAHHPPHPAFDYPLLIAVVELDEGTRLITNLTGVTADDLAIGMPLEVEWLVADADLTLPLFRPVAPQEH